MESFIGSFNVWIIEESSSESTVEGPITTSLEVASKA